MSIHEKLWRKLPEVLCFVVHDDKGFSGFCYRPCFDEGNQEWGSDSLEQFDCLDINSVVLPRPFMRLRKLPPPVAIFQRPSSWDGELRQGDSVKLSHTTRTYSVSGFFNHEKIWLEDSETRDITLTTLGKVVLVNGMTISGKSLRTIESAKMPDLPPEVHNETQVDVDKAMAVLRSMCRSSVLSG
ncbi:hypothetical protein [Candidatus Sororendozoicomonas aggregata]|uniref:hypothetical protein n=1 Tax=Candidatus Sororendozoicomonas aggregata TaxID=3073239 RepID=UPI002ED22A5D